MDTSNLLTGCELHLHILGAYYAEDIFELGRDHYCDINWDQWDFVDAYEAAGGQYSPQGDSNLQFISSVNIVRLRVNKYTLRP